MDTAAERRLMVASARAEFLSVKDDADLQSVPSLVAASWRRSASLGVRSNRLTNVFHSDLDLASKLVRCADPIIERLSEEVADIPVCIALTDSRARILRRADSNAWIGRLLDNVHFATGFGYAEEAVGTNGVGTVLEYGESVHITGPEHYVESLQTFSCAGAPIRDPLTGRIEGVLDVSCLSDQSSPVMHSLVRSAAREIERNLLLDRSQPMQALFDVYTRIDARCREAILAVGPKVVLSNSLMRTLVTPEDQATLEAHVRYRMTTPGALDEPVTLPSGLISRVRGAQVTVGTKVAGIVAVVTVPDLMGQREGGLRSLPSAGLPTANGEGPRESPVSPHLVGKSPAWRMAISQLETAIQSGQSLLVLGEPGTGRFTAISESHDLLNGDKRSVVIDAEHANAQAEKTADLLSGVNDVPTMYIIRRLDRLTAETVETLRNALDRQPASQQRPWLTATALPSAGTHPYEGLLSHFDTSLTLPPLRHRGADITHLISALLTDLAPQRDVRLTREATRAIIRHDWPGNIRELRESLRKALLNKPVGMIGIDDLPAVCHSAPSTSLTALEAVERDAIVLALQAAHGNRVEAAAALGVARSTLYRKIKHYGITR